MAQSEKWTQQEENRLVQHVKLRPQNLKKCFIAVAEEIDRTPTAVQAHWYAVTSKKPENLCFFTASQRHVSRNRKNGEGVQSNGNIWRRLMAVLRNIL